MSKQTPIGRVGRIRGRLQFLNPRSQHWTELNTSSGKLTNVKSDSKPFKAVRKYKTK